MKSAVYKILKKHSSSLFFLFILGFLYIFLYQIFLPRINAFGCFDDCFNFLAGYFLSLKKVLYSQIFFNHAPIPAFLSYAIQETTKPINIYDLVLKHRLTLFFFSFLFNAFLIIRFRFPAFLFAVIFETSKFYLFGDRFLAESFIVYPLVYLLGWLVLKFRGEKLFPADYILSSVSAWFVIFTREPYVPVAAFLFLLVLRKASFRNLALSLSVFGMLSLWMLSRFPLHDFFFNVATGNKETILKFEIEREGGGFLNRLLSSAGYPFLVFTSDVSGFFKTILLLLCAGLVVSFIGSIRKSNSRFLVSLFLVLTLANTRPVAGGAVFYEAFHLLPWYALAIFATVFLALSLKRLWLKLIVLLSILAIPTLMFFSKDSFFFEKISPHEEFMTNFGPVQEAGSVFKDLSNGSGTLFLDGFDDLIYLQAKMYSPYEYSWYTSVMPKFEKYTSARLLMFENNPPDFYYGTCPNVSEVVGFLPDFAKGEYTNIPKDKKPSCVYIRNDVFSQISNKQWEKVAESGYEKPE